MWNASKQQEQCECTCGKSGCHSRVLGTTVHGVSGSKKKCSCDLCREAAQADNRRRVARLQDTSLAKAERKGQTWTSAELELLTRKDLTSEFIAGQLNRSYKGVVSMRYRLNKEPKLQLLVYGEILRK